MKVTYIHHSCFSVEMKNVVFLFDYYKGTLPSFDSKKHIFVFSSHKHPDHFDCKIFDLVKEYPHITFVLSNDIKMNESYMNRKNIPIEARKYIYYLGKNVSATYPITNISNSSIINKENREVSSTIHVETLKSTDEGVAFIITYNGKVIYHAGDLNWWSWRGETEEEYTLMTNNFMMEMDKIRDRHFDVAFVPLDPRQEERFSWGFDYFMKNTRTDVVFPMHFWMDYTVIKRLKNMDIAKDYTDRIISISQENQTFHI